MSLRSVADNPKGRDECEAVSEEFSDRATRADGALEVQQRFGRRGIVQVSGGEFFDGVEGAAADGLTLPDGEERFDHVHPRGVGGGEMQGDTRVSSQPLLHFLVFVGGVVVHD